MELHNIKNKASDDGRYYCYLKSCFMNIFMTRLEILNGM